MASGEGVFSSEKITSHPVAILGVSGLSLDRHKEGQRQGWLFVWKLQRARREVYAVPTIGDRGCSFSMLLKAKFLSATVSALLAGSLAIYAPNHLIFSAVAAGIGAACFPIFQSLRRYSTSVWTLLCTMFAVLSVMAILYATVIDNYRIGQNVFVVVENGQSVHLRSGPGKEFDSVGLAQNGLLVQYTGRGWRRLHFKREDKRYFEYWRRVYTQEHPVAWIYGAYLSSVPDV